MPCPPNVPLAKYLGVAQEPTQSVHFAVFSALSEPFGERVWEAKGIEFVRLLFLTSTVRHDCKAVFSICQVCPANAPF